MAFVVFVFFFTHLRHTYTMYNNIVVYEQNNRHYNFIMGTFGNRSNNFYSNLYHLIYYVSIILLLSSIYGGSSFHITQGRLPGRPGVV